MNKTKTYYQPYIYCDDGTNIEWVFPEDLLYSFQAFATKEDCEEFMDRNGYSICEINVVQYHDDDIEDVTILDANGDVIEVNGETYVYDVGVLDKNGDEIDEIYITAEDEDEMWAIFDNDYKADYAEYDSAVIYDCNLQ